MCVKQTEAVVRIPIDRWRSTRFAVRVRETQRHRSLAIPTARRQKRTQGSFTASDARAP